MAKENVKLFYDALKTEEALRKKLQEKEAAYTGDKNDREAIVAEILLPIAEATGYAFTIEELKEYESDLLSGKELSDDEMESVAGGDIVGFCCIVGVGAGWECEGLGYGTCFLVGHWG